MKDLLVRRIYTRYSIHIAVEIDYIKKTISIVEKDGKPKKWLFKDRSPDYLNGWMAIFRAMDYAITQVQKEFDAIDERDYKELVEAYSTLDKALRRGNGNPKPGKESK